MAPKKAAAAKPAAPKSKVNGIAKTSTKVATKATPAVSSSTTTAKTVTKTATKAAPKAPATTNASKKRKAVAEDDDDEEKEDSEPRVNGTVNKKSKTATAVPIKKTTTNKATEAAPPATKRSPTPKASKAPASKKPKITKPKDIVNSAPTEVLDVYTFGGGENGELGFAGAKGTREIRRPRVNPYLSPDKAGVVQFSVGGMHTACLTHDNKILTWGVNDQGALGRDTTWDGGLKDMKPADDGDDDSDSDSDEGELNPHESTPGEVLFPDQDNKLVFTQVCATDSATFAVTEEGDVYGWGTFRSNEGVFGFSKETIIQPLPVVVEKLKKIVKLAGGSNHVLALDNKGKIWTWGAGQQDQLGRRVLERHQKNSLEPMKLGLRGAAVDIGAGSYHSFAVQNSGKVYSWGLNSFGQTGGEVDIEEGTGGVHLPLEIKALSSKDHGKVIQIAGGGQHSIAITDQGEALVWGRVDGYQVGIDTNTLPEDAIIKDAGDRPRILTVPTRIPEIEAVAAGVGTDHSIVVAKDGKAYGFGFNEYGQTGVGGTDDIKVATHIDNTAVRSKKLVVAGCGGQFSVLGSIAPQTNGHTSE